jgi:hypothetical protein
MVIEMVTKYKEGEFRCYYCGEPFPNYGIAKAHENTHRPKKEK